VTGPSLSLYVVSVPYWLLLRTNYQVIDHSSFSFNFNPSVLFSSFHCGTIDLFVATLIFCTIDTLVSALI
jgi:hypothetical protein